MANEIYLDTRILGVLTDATSVVLKDSTGNFGIRERESLTVTVAANTPYTGKLGTGRYYYDISALDRTVEYEAVWYVVPTVGDPYYVTEVIPIAQSEPTATAYCTVVEAGTYFANRLHTEAWDQATAVDQAKALIMASDAIDRLNFNGSKTDDDQERQFPRDDDVDVPNDIKIACMECAIAFLDGVSPELEYENLDLTSQGYSSVRSTYNHGSPQPHIVAGIPSATAWRYLKPYLRDWTRVRLSRG